MKTIFTLFALLYSTTAIAQAIGTWGAIDNYIYSYEITNDFSGCVLVTKFDQEIFSKCYGFANDQDKIRNKRSTQFRIGSISKQMTAVAILRLEELGMLSTEDRVSKWFPESEIADSISIHQLLKHRSGVKDIFQIPGFDELKSNPPASREFAELILKQGLDFAPGTNYQYSNGGYALLGAIIEIESSQTYEEALKELVFDPLHMLRTGESDTPNLATGYEPLGFDGREETNFIPTPLLLASGSLYSSVDDVSIWIEALSKEVLLSKSSWTKFFNNYKSGYGYGISFYSVFNQTVFGHDGRISGFIADYLYYRESKTKVIVLGNIQTGVVDFFRADIAAIVFDKPYESSAKSIQPVENKPANMNKLEGIYSFGPSFNVYVDLMNDKLMARANEGSYSELVPLNDGRYFSRTLYSFIEFKQDTMFWTNNDGNRFEGTLER